MKHAFIPAILLIAFAGSLQSQSKAPLFEVASVKLNPAPGRVLIHFGPDNVNLTSIDLQIAVILAYGVRAFQIEGPGWVSDGTTRFNVEAKSSRPVPEDQLRLMLQTLLADRFHLALHHEQKEIPVLALRPGNSGIKLKPFAGATPPDTQWLGFLRVSQAMSDNEHHVFTNAPMEAVAAAVSASCTGPSTLPPVVDQTGLSGRFDFALRNLPPPPPDAGTPTDDDQLAACDLIVQQDLGLTLSRTKAPIDILVIDHADKVPTEN